MNINNIKVGDSFFWKGSSDVFHQIGKVIEINDIECNIYWDFIKNSSFNYIGRYPKHMLCAWYDLGYLKLIISDPNLICKRKKEINTNGKV